MEDSLQSKAWAIKVRRSYDWQLAEGIVAPILPETLLWQAPGQDEEGKSHIDRLGELGITTRFNPQGIQLVPIDNETVSS